MIFIEKQKRIFSEEYLIIFDEVAGSIISGVYVDI